jgi:hypothetical protein
MPTDWLQGPQAMDFDIPLIGDDITKIGRIIDLYAVPCSPNAEIWVYGFFAAIPTLFITLTKPEIIDISINHRGGKPRKGKRYRFTAQDLFRDAIIDIKVPRWVIFRVYEWTQRIGWYFLVADALEDFGINWMTLAYKYNGCQTPLLTYGQYDNNAILQGSDNPPAVSPLLWTATASSNVTIQPFYAQLIVDGTYRVSWSCTFTPYFDASVSGIPYTTFLTVDGAVAGIGEVWNTGNGGSGASGDMIVRRFGPPNPTLQICGSWLDYPKLCYMSGTWSIARQEDNELSPDP